MNEKVNNKSIFRCNNCNKNYASKSSLCNHIKKFHIDLGKGSVKEGKGYGKGLVKESEDSSKDLIKESEDKLYKLVNLQEVNIIIKKYFCKFCNKEFQYKQSKYDHQKNYCKKKNNNDESEMNKLKEQTKQKELDIILKKEEAKILNLKLKLEKSNKIDNITLRQLNKKLLERNNLIKNSNIHSNNNNQIQNNNIINNNTFNLIGFGKEDIVELLTMQEKKQIMNAKFCCLEKLVEIIHCGKYNQFKNIIITNMKDNYIYKYDDDKGQFVLSMKSNVLNSLIDCRVSDIEIIYNELVENNKLDKNTKDMVEKFINRINNDNFKYNDYDGVQHETYKHHKINEVKVLLYNNQDKITNDISLILTTTDEILPVVKSYIDSLSKIEEIDY